MFRQLGRKLGTVKCSMMQLIIRRNKLHASFKRVVPESRRLFI